MWQPSCEATSGATPASSSSHKKAMALPHLTGNLDTAFSQMNISFSHFDIAVAFQRRHGFRDTCLGYAQVFGDVN